MSSLRTSALGAILYLAVLAAGINNPSFNLADGLVDRRSHKLGQDTCRDAFSVDVACGPELGELMRTRSMYREGSRLPTDDELDPFCTDSCYVSLLEYRQSVRSHCGDAVYKEPRHWKPSHHAELALFAYKRRCLKNPDGQYCNVLGERNLPRVLTDLRCDGCWSRMLHLEATCPLNPRASERATQLHAFQRSYCPPEGNSFRVTDCWRGGGDCACKKLIHVKPQDTWLSLSLEHSVTTRDLSRNNGLDFVPGNLHRFGLLCIPSPCRLHAIEMGDTCDSIAAAAGVERGELVDWNPYIESRCNNLSFRAGETICVSERFVEGRSGEEERKKMGAHGDSPFDVDEDQDVLAPDDL
ncbi:hypothetical protein CEP51_015716 [Fusarium floridanum]|uniref:LysM domain-containing protein n=1 Tax=Fusarium floridanum TaxID=1325733 RepID=A0A428P4G5_9HYPO|nr:hypothetical protein CEP51_015716 [Fusarium floridanum]